MTVPPPDSTSDAVRFVELLQRDPVSTATLHEVHGQRGALPSQIKALDHATRVVGRARPVRCSPGHNLWIHEALYRASPGDVLVVDVGRGFEYGYWGEVMTVAAMSQNLGGIVIDGGVRDVDRLRESGFPVFARRICIRGTSKRPDPVGTFDAPVRVGAVTVAAGDLIVGDGDGVVVIARSEIEEVVCRARERDEAETLTMDALRNGERTIDRIRRPAPTDARS